MTPEILQAIKDLTFFADAHAYDVYEPDENPQFVESYDDIINAIKTVTTFIQTNN